MPRSLPIPLQSSQLPGSRPSSYTTEKAGGGVKWVDLMPSRARCVCPFPAVASRCCSAPSRTLSVYDENPRLTVCTAWDCLPALRTHIASIVFHHLLWCRPERNTRERTAILAAFSHTLSFPVHGVIPATRLSLGTRSHNRPPFNRNSSNYVQHRIRALGPTPFEVRSSIISLAICEMLSAALG
ncbi:hypothetical protein B0H14DRAFT_1449585 [Mycena olivaceomarginata]|nr:hypothetical protein B0H14DRAFT_1449585 [Mycena olivaceomarginata]